MQASEVEESLPPRAPCKKEPLDIPLKKAKFIEDKYRLDYQLDYQYQVLLAQYRQNPYHGFRPWAQLPLTAPPLPPSSSTSTTQGVSSKHLPHMPYSALPYLSQEPPVLQNPERVVRISECERYEQSYQPNVALAPRNGSSKTTTTSSSTTTNSSTNLSTKIDAVSVAVVQQPNGATEYENGDRPLAMDVKIKEERPQTPSDESQSPESCTQPQNHIITTANAVPPISPEGQSASEKEITSSTSPVPAAPITTTFDKLNDSTIHSPAKTITPPDVTTLHHHHHHHIKQIINRSHSKSSTDLSSSTVHVVQPSDLDLHHLHNNHHHLHNNHHHLHRSQQNGTIETRPYHSYYSYKHKLNGLSSEFELSTDTDDDSLIGEADSSNHMSPLDIANETLKDVDPKIHDKVLNVIKALLHENEQISIKNAKLLQELQRKEEEIADLIQANRLLHSTSSYLASNRSDSSSLECSSKHSNDKFDGDDIKMVDDHRNENEQKDLDSLPAISKTDSVTIHVVDKVKLEKHHDHHLKTETATITVKKAMTGAVPATVIEVGKPIIESIDTKSMTNGTATITTSTKFGAKSETEVIRMPLKKSVRRTPTEDTTSAATTAATVVIMQPHKLRDEARDKSCDKSEKLLRTAYDTTTASSTSPIHQKHTTLVTAKATD